jgi:hypothetical protein
VPEFAVVREGRLRVGHEARVMSLSMAWHWISRRRWHGEVAAAAPPEELLRRRVRRCVDAEDTGPAMESAALAEVSTVLDQVTTATADGSAPDAGTINDVAMLHRLRAMGLEESLGSEGSFEELHACGAAQVLIHAVDPASVAPQIRADTANAVSQGAPTDVPTAVLHALQGNASAVRAAWRRQPDPVLADLYVRAFQRLVEFAGPDIPGHPTRLLDLAAALYARFDHLQPDGAAADLNEAIRLTNQTLAACAADPAADPAAAIRAHQLRAPMLAHRDELQPGTVDLAEAGESFRALVELTHPDDPQHADYRRRLAMVQQLLAGPNQPPPTSPPTSPPAHPGR